MGSARVVRFLLEVSSYLFPLIVLLKHLIKLEHVDIMDEAVDEAIGDEVNGLDAIDGRQLRSKEIDYTLRSGNSIMLQSHEVVTLGEGDHYQSTPNLFTDILDRKNLDRIGSSEHASASPRCMNDAGVMVEELTLRNYNGKNMAVVGALGNKETMHIRPNQWFYQLAGGSACASSHGEAAYRNRCRTSSGLWEEEEGDALFSGLLNQKTSDENYNLDVENLQNNGDKAVLNNVLPSSEGIRTKIISKSGFSEYIVKSTLKGKGVICKTQLPRVSASEFQGQIHPQWPNASSTIASMNAFSNPNVYQDGISLRERLKAGGNKLNKDEGLYIFKQVLDLVDLAHSQGISVQHLRPSCFKLLLSNQVVYIGASARTQVTKCVVDRGVTQSDNNQKERSSAGKHFSSLIDPCVKKQKISEDTHLKRKWPHNPFKSDHNSACRNTKLNASHGYGDESNEEDFLKTEPNSPSKFRLPQLSNMSKPLLTSMSFKLEEKWYTSPEQFSEGGCTFSSNIYCLGVLLFELLSSFNCERSHAAAMLDLRHRILPSCFLSEHPKEAGFCLWLLHPEPSARPTTREILQSGIIAEIKELPGDVSLSSIHEKESESELLLYFLMSLKDQKQKDATTLVEELKCIEADVQEVQRRQSSKTSFPSSHQESVVLRENRFIQKGASSSDVYPKLPPVCEKETRLVKNIRQLESAYFSMRSNIQPTDDVAMVRRTEEVLNNQENFVLTGNDKQKYSPTDRLGGFFEGLCKYGRYSKFRARGILRNADLNNFANVICSLSFDRDEEYLAAGGVSKKIKVFEYQALFNDSVDIHYPIIEMSNRSKLSCICWNSYIRNYLASTDYDGAVKLWDASTGQDFSHLTEHNERAWSVDFSRVDPTKLASGSDDHLVKLWSINEKNSVCTIRNKANVCCVQFSPNSSHFLAYSSADYKTYCYDLRNISVPWCILAGHEKAASYAKFLDAETLISASTDNSLKIWDLNKTNSSGYSVDACVLTLKGHTNEKNFVGLSVNNGYITCGSETNEVFAYYKSLPMPITSHKFGSIDPISGKETDDDNGQFVSSVCWRQKSNTVLAASSSGCIKLLEMV
ncbi:protein SPA1-RELATED 2 isoform X1 [Capsicum annuum]|uniref:protein SPA1-RELATED 2 isoform X1 n=2 Tax=Capsicum annuum TaxID=4072 RepID=UPI001FB17C7C|nr:protein SPA1-RELATED 2 isoform X1 [Capsicum annuum]